jgi:excisionase family DNA binding protein
MHAHLAMTVSQVARALHVGERRVRRWIKDGELPAFSIGEREGTRISVRAVENFIQARTFNVVTADRCRQTADDSL